MLLQAVGPPSTEIAPMSRRVVDRKKRSHTAVASDECGWLDSSVLIRDPEAYGSAAAFRRRAAARRQA